MTLPIRVLAYHATVAPEDFDRFELTEDIGFHFGTKETANTRLAHIGQVDLEDLEAARILPCLLTLQRPLRLPDCHTWGMGSVLPALREAGVISDSQSDELWTDGYLDREMFRDLLLSAGFDSVIYANETEGGGDSYLIVEPKRIEFALTVGYREGS